EEGVYATSSALHITLTYMCSVAALFLFAPEFLLELFRNAHQDPREYRMIMDLGVVLLRFVAAFCFFDGLNLIFSGAIKGAGDTRFIMWAIAALSLGVMILPVYLAVEILGSGIYVAWSLATLYVCALGTAFMLRYRQGKWMAMRVIEARPAGSSAPSRGRSPFPAPSGGFGEPPGDPTSGRDRIAL
ncbi:MAG: hypothetical protein JW821_09760, partial [Deltaproteobacteria bacterium]|nr:hypothetical protein [Deltaproteobacteria bacterium]